MTTQQSYPAIDSLKLRMAWAREAKGISQADAARAFNVTPGAVHQWESLSRRPLPSLENLIRAADIYGVDFSWLATGRASGATQALPEPALDRALLAAAITAYEQVLIEERLEPRTPEDKAQFLLGLYDWLVENRDGLSADVGGAVRQLRGLIRSLHKAH